MFSLASLLHLMQTGGPWLVGVATAVEAMGIPTPAESLLIACGIIAGTTGRLDIAAVVAAAAAGAIVGHSIGFAIGRWLGTRALRRWGPKIGLDEDRLLLGTYLFRRHGAKVVIFGRFVMVLRTFAALLAGANAMTWPRFLLANAVGGIAWAGLYGFGAYLLGAEARHVAGPLGIALAVVAVVAIGAALLYVRRHEQRLIAEARRQAEAERQRPRRHRARAAPRTTDSGCPAQDRRAGPASPPG
jgi:membrane protein DedA with SNARE-associated domain